MCNRGSGRLSLSCVWLPIVAAMAILAATPAAGYASEGHAAVSWGENWHSQLGTFYRNTREESPVPVEGLTNVTAIASGGSFSLALQGNGKVASFGGNGYGQLGDAGYKASWELGKSHVAVGELSGVSAISAADEHALALLANGTVMAWGNNEYGELGDGKGGFEEATGQNERSPKTVEGLKGVIAIASGGPSNFALLANGTVMAWGSNAKGQLGIEWPETCEKLRTPGCGSYECKTETGTELCSTRPLPVMRAKETPLGEVAAIAAGGEAAYALLRDGRVISWGSNQRGQLGQVGIETGPHGKFIPPGKVMRSSSEPLEDVKEVSAGYSHVLARLADGQIFGWGNDERGELGGTGPGPPELCLKHAEALCFTLARPIRALRRATVEAVSAGAQYSLALIGHKVYAWGKNENGELGDGNTSDSRVPSPIEGLGPVSAISAGNTHAVALLQTGAPSPPPAVAVEPEQGALKVTWRADDAEKELYRMFERPGADEGEEESEEGEGSGSAGGGGEEGAPKNLTRPRVRGEAREGQTLTVSEGTWTGTEPINYEYQWERCKGGQCVPILGATGSTYLLGPEDVKSTLQVLVTASNSVPPPGSATSPPSEVVKTEEEGRRAKLEEIKLSGAEHSDVIDELDQEKPLEALPYEIKFYEGGKQRIMVGTPLPMVK